jgi:hypothetical protein
VLVVDVPALIEPVTPDEPEAPIVLLSVVPLVVPPAEAALVPALPEAPMVEPVVPAVAAGSLPELMPEEALPVVAPVVPPVVPEVPAVDEASEPLVEGEVVLEPVVVGVVASSRWPQADRPSEATSARAATEIRDFFIRMLL